MRAKTAASAVGALRGDRCNINYYPSAPTVWPIPQAQRLNRAHEMESNSSYEVESSSGKGKYASSTGHHRLVNKDRREDVKLAGRRPAGQRNSQYFTSASLILCIILNVLK